MTKEIKSHIQRWPVDKVVRVLQKADAPGISIIEIHPVGHRYEPNYFDPAYESEDIMKRYSNLSILKLEVICRDEDADRFGRTIQDTACTHSRGDGWVFVTDIVQSVRIKDGTQGEGAL